MSIAGGCLARGTRNDDGAGVFDCTRIVEDVEDELLEIFCHCRGALASYVDRVKSARPGDRVTEGDEAETGRGGGRGTERARAVGGEAYVTEHQHHGRCRG